MDRAPGRAGGAATRAGERAGRPSGVRLNRRGFLRAGALAAAAGLAGGRAGARAAEPPGRLRKILDIGPDGVIDPGSAQDFRYHDNPFYFADTRTPWIRMWADWPSLQPDPLHAPDDPASPGYWRLQALDAQVALANARGLRVLLVPLRFPTWANGTAALAAVKDSDAEIAFEHWDRVTPATWARYLRAGRDPRAYNPPRRALEFRVPDGDAFGPLSAWAAFFAFLYGRYHYGRRWLGPYVDAFELVNEPNLMLWPQQAAAPAGGDPFARAPATMPRRVAELMRTAQAVSARFGHSTPMLAPSLSDGAPASTRLHTRDEEFAAALLDAFEPLGYRPHPRQAWSHHNYTDVEHRLTETRTQALRAVLRGRWDGLVAGPAPTVFVTEGGARLSQMPKLYPREDPLQAQARCLRDAWALHAGDSGAGAGVAMFAQYLLYADPNFDSGLIDPFPSTARRPAYDAWRSFPGYA